MTAQKPNAKNERIKRKYAQYLEQALGQSETSADKTLAAIVRFEESTRRKGFERFHIEQAKKFKDQLASEVNPKTGKPLAKGTITATLKALRTFLRWLSQEPGYRRSIRPNDADYFSPTLRDDRIARSAAQRPSPSVEQVRHVLAQMPDETAVQQRDRAMFATLLVTGIRVGALIGLKLRHINLKDRLLTQDPRDIRTKFGKRIETWFFPVGDEVEAILFDYVAILKTELLWGPDDPLFPRSLTERNADGNFETTGLDRAHWATSSPVRDVVKEAFAANDLPRYGPHSFRKTLVRLGQQLCKSPEDFKAWSQNLGHEDVMTTFASYGTLSPDRQREVIGRMWNGRS